MNVQERVLAWWKESRRDLPWRRTREPWAVLVSELMLQQTQVARVVPAYASFLRRFPTPDACARAPVGDVVRAWSGLGYNRRAVNLHRAATVAAAAGGVPGDLPALLALPGVGPYTARAVLAFAFERDVAVLDGNTTRVLARALGVRGQREADGVVPPGQGWAWNQALLDLGATVCTRRAPRCGSCPLATTCQWRGEGVDPAPPPPGQAAFEGSDRQGRGRLVAALTLGDVAAADLAAVTGWPDDPVRAERVAASLVADGLALRTGAVLRLP